MKFFLALMIVTLALGATPQDVSQWVDEFYLVKQFSHTFDTNHCPANPKACADKVCSYLNWPGCTDESTLLAMVRACRGNYNEQCLSTVCGYLNWPGCTEKETVVTMANACSGNLDAECVKFACGKINWPGCTEKATGVRVAQACGGQD